MTLSEQVTDQGVGARRMGFLRPAGLRREEEDVGDVLCARQGCVSLSHPALSTGPRGSYSCYPVTAEETEVQGS